MAGSPMINHGSTPGITRFQCVECGDRFEPSQGGICERCHRLLCRKHFGWFATTPVCLECRAKASASEQARGAASS